MNQALLYHSLALDILFVTYFLTLVTMPDPPTSDMLQIRQMMSALPLESARLSKQWILWLKDLLDGDLCKKILYFHILSFFLVFKHDFIRCVDFTHIAASNIASDNVTNKVTHRIFRLNIFLCSFCSRKWWKSSLNGRFRYDLMIFVTVAYFLGHHVHHAITVCCALDVAKCSPLRFFAVFSATA